MAGWWLSKNPWPRSFLRGRKLSFFRRSPFCLCVTHCCPLQSKREGFCSLNSYKRLQTAYPLHPYCIPFESPLGCIKALLPTHSTTKHCWVFTKLIYPNPCPSSLCKLKPPLLPLTHLTLAVLAWNRPQHFQHHQPKPKIITVTCVKTSYASSYALEVTP